MRKSANRFSRYNQPVKCPCGKGTTERTGGGTGLCAACYEAAGLENEHFDGGHKGAPVQGCPQCVIKVGTVVQFMWGDTLKIGKVLRVEGDTYRVESVNGVGSIAHSEITKIGS